MLWSTVQVVGHTKEEKNKKIPEDYESNVNERGPHDDRYQRRNTVYNRRLRPVVDTTSTRIPS